MQQSPHNLIPAQRYTFRVLRYLCKTCSQCIAICPVEAISYGNDNSAWIDPKLCISCGNCLKSCPHYAIRSH
ncbi:MAG TPA: 4Fe-4S binding protein [Patescibacteria group bacterium]|nr:4Fe-4S binding protein [Patescibacteria group bacterium]